MGNGKMEFQQVMFVSETESSGDFEEVEDQMDVLRHIKMDV